MITGYSTKFMGNPNSGLGLEFNIPSKIKGHTVTAIADRALREGITRIFGITLPPTIKEIGDNAFSWCKSLTNLTISDGVENIGEAAFFRCNSLNEVTIPRSVTQIDMHAFGWDYVDDYDVRNENLVIK